MVKVRIGGTSRTFADLRSVEDQWIHQQINSVSREQGHVCVFVTIEEPPLKISLATSACKASGGGSPLTDLQLKVLDIWRQERLDADEITGGHVTAFLKRTGSLIR